MSIKDFTDVHKEMNSFMRIAMAQQARRYRYKPQRRSVCAKMYVRWVSRKYEQSPDYVSGRY